MNGRTGLSRTTHHTPNRALDVVGSDLRIEYLADRPEVMPVLRAWFETEWMDCYGPGGSGDAQKDLIAYSSRKSWPIGLVAFSGGHLCGIAALKPESISTHTHLCPWAAAGLVAAGHSKVCSAAVRSHATLELHSIDTSDRRAREAE
jgi:hypothetical protein